MDWNYVLLIAIVVSLLLIMIQRAERKRRKLAMAIVLMCFLVIRHNISIKPHLNEETAVAFGIGFVISALFWLLIGRYNPVGSSDSIEVIGMDD